MVKVEREKEIMLLLEECNYATVEYLAKKMHISTSSIRRDLSALESRGLVKRSYGGVERVLTGNRVVPFSMRSHEHYREKVRIAKKAATLLSGGEVVFLDGSSSTFHMIDYIAGIKGLTVATNNIDSVRYLAQYKINAYSTGGNISGENSAALVGGYAEHLIRNMHADFAFFSAQAVAPGGDIFDCYETEVPLRRLMLQNAKKKVFLSDGSKFLQNSVFFLENIRNIDYVVTDAQLPQSFTVQFPGTVFLMA